MLPPCPRSAALSLMRAVTLFILAGCGGSSAGGGNSTTLNALNLTTSTSALLTNDSQTATLTVTTSPVMAGVSVTVTTDTGVLNQTSGTTNASGIVTFTFRVGANTSPRTANITATAGAISATIPIQIKPATVLVSSTSSNLLSNGSTPATLTVLVEDAAGVALPGTAVTLTQPTPNVVTLASVSGVTDPKGLFTSSVAGATAGTTTTVTATALGVSANSSFTVAAAGVTTPPSTTFFIQKVDVTSAGVTTTPALKEPIQIKAGDTLVLTVSVTSTAPANVLFNTTLGALGFFGTGVNTATATLTSVNVGTAVVTASDQAGNTASLIVVVTASGF